MKVKNIMFSGLMAAILMGTAGAQAAVEIASKGYVDTEVAKKAGATEFADLKGVVENAETGLATKASKTELQNAQTTLQNAIDLKANAADVYTIEQADDRFQTLEKAAQDATAATNYTNEKVQELADTLGGVGEDGQASGLISTVTAQGNKISDLETKVGSETVANQISSAITALGLENTYGAKSAVEANTSAITAINNAETGLLAQAKADAAAKADKALEDAKAYTDQEVSAVDAKFADYTKTTELDTTFATDTEVAGVKSELEGKIGAKVAQSDYDTKVGELEGAIAANKGATETNAEDIKAINESAVMNSGITAEKRAAYDQAVTDLTTKITMPEICQSKNCVLSTLNGVPTWVEITVPIE